MAKTLSSLKWKAAGYRILRLLEGSMFFTQVLTAVLCSLSNFRFLSLRISLNGYYLVRF